MMRDIRITTVSVKTNPLVEVFRHRSGKESVRLIDGVDRKVSALGRCRPCRRRVAQQVKELKRQAAPVPALRFQLNAIEVGISNLAVNADVAIGRLIESPLRRIRIEPSRQRLARGRVPY